MGLLRLIIIGFFCYCLQGCASTMMAQQMQLGKRSFSDGNFKIAFRQLLPVAVYGKPEAEYAVGYMYYYGYGVPRDTESGLFWMSRAAEQCYCPAIKALAIIRRGPAGCYGEISEERGYVGVVRDYRTYRGDCRTYKDEGALPHLQHDAVMQSLGERSYYQHDAAYHYPSIQYQPATFAPQPPPPPPPPSEPRMYPQPIMTSPPPPPISSKAKEINNFLAPSNHSNVKANSRSLPPQQWQRVSENHYTLQLYGAFNLEHARNLQSELGLSRSTHIWQTKNQDKDWYVLTYGKYATLADARMARDQLPEKISNFEPWVRKTETLQRIV